MAPEQARKLVADVKCYHCGHISGQIIVLPEQPGVRNFVPRPGYSGPKFQSGQRMRCERCQGPVYLERQAYTPPLRLVLQEESDSSVA